MSSQNNQTPVLLRALKAFQRTGARVLSNKASSGSYSDTVGIMLRARCLDEECLAGFADGTLPGRSLKDRWQFIRVKHHLKRCALCRAALQALSEALVLVDPVSAETARGRLEAIMPPRPVPFYVLFAPAAASSFVLLCLFGFSFWGINARHGRQLIAERQASKMELERSFLIGFERGRAESIVIGPEKGVGLSPFPPLSPEGKVWNEIPPATNRGNVERAIWTLTRYTKHPKGPTPESDPLRYAELLYYKMELRKLSTDLKEHEKLDQEIADLSKQLAPYRGRLGSWMNAIQGRSTDESQGQ